MSNFLTTAFSYVLSSTLVYRDFLNDDGSDSSGGSVRLNGDVGTHDKEFVSDRSGDTHTCANLVSADKLGLPRKPLDGDDGLVELVV